MMRESLRRIVIAPVIAGLLIGGLILSQTSDENTPKTSWTPGPTTTNWSSIR